MDIEKNQSCPESSQNSIDLACESRNGFSKEEIITEVKQQVLLAGPLVAVYLFLCFLQVISITFVGHLGELALSGASVATAFISMVGYSLLRGMGSALETFLGQSYGAKEYHMLGIHLQRGLIVLLLVSIPVGVLLANVANILKFCKQDPEISDEAGRFARFLIPGVFGVAIHECHVRFLLAQNNVAPMLVSSGIATLLHIPICWFLVFKSGLGSRGAALANSISFWVNPLLLVSYVWFSPSCKKTWTGFSEEAFHRIPKFLKLAIPSTIMLSLEIWSSEMMVMLGGVLPNAKLEVAVLSISFNIYMLVYMIPLALSGAVSTRVSNELGGGRPKAARLAVCVAVVMVVVEGIITVTVMVSGRKVWGYLYSKEIKVVKYVGEMLLLVAASHFLNAIDLVLSGTCRGCGWQKIGAFLNLGSYYLIGFPCSVALAFVLHIGGKGLWVGFIVALFVQACSFSIITLCTDWQKQARKARDRVHNTMTVRDADALPQS